ncbi:MAG: shikimate dehydrogenase [Alphaproteobacteria bacterium]
MPDTVGAIAEAIEALLLPRAEERRGHHDVLVGLIGRGIQSSRTPTMHEREAERLGLSCAYVLIDFDALGLSDADLAATLRAAEALRFNGVNVTYPFKQAVMPLLDEIRPEAAAIGAVNTVVFGGRTIGHNTDYWGFAESFRAQMGDVARDRVIVFGAGGAGSAVSAALIGLGATEISLVDPDVSRASDLVRRLSPTGTTKIVVAEDALAAMKAANGIVNTTPIGMATHPGTPFPIEWLSPDQWVADIIYFPQETELLLRARDIGCRTLAGTGMAIGQAVRAFEHFTGRAADMAAMAGHFEAAA